VIRTSEQTNEISAALAKAQGTVKNPTKGRTAQVRSDKGNYSYTYATLADSLEAIREGLSANGLAVIQATRIEGDVLMLDTRLSHASGQWVEAEYPVCKFPSAPQVIGSALTYARRYALFGVVGIAGEDDDGEAASKAEISAPPPMEFINSDQTEELSVLLGELGEEVEKGFRKFFKIDFLGRLPARDYATAMNMIAKKKAQKVAEPA
jgi:hypothetical protein